MKKTIFAFACLLLLTFSCKEEELIRDEVFEAVSFKGNVEVSVNEFTFSEDGYPVVAQLWAAKPYSTDVDITLEVTTSNTEAGTDFVAIPAVLKIKAGKLISDTLWVKTIDNAVAATTERGFQVKLKSTSQADIKIGFGITNPTQTAIDFTIVDDECSATTGIFNANFNNNIHWISSGTPGDALKPATGTLVGNELTVVGNLIDYGTFPNATITITLAPVSEGATRGSATFGTQTAGTDNDGYEYQFRQKGNGAYDVCEETVTVSYDIYYWDSDWVLWYEATNVFSLVGCTETVDVFNTNLTNKIDYGDGPIEKPASGTISGNELTVTGNLIDYGAFSGATLTIPLTPYKIGGTKGKAFFGEQVTGMDTDGYEYKFVQIGEGSYNICTGKINVEYEIYYRLGAGGWSYWYSVKNEFSIP